MIPAKVDTEKDMDLLIEGMASGDERFSRLWKYLILTAFIWHTVLIVWFAVLSVNGMVFINLVCIALWLAAYSVNRRALYRKAALIGRFLIIGYAAAAVIFVGWDSGFHYYVLFLAGFDFLSFWRCGVISRIRNFVIGLAIYAGLNVYAAAKSPLAAVSSDTALVMNLFNITLIFGGFFLLSYYYQSSFDSVRLMRETNQKLKVLAGHDPLTKLVNRRKMMSLIQEAVNNHDKYCTSLAIIMSDIDDFKAINDTYGHEAGDFVLVETANIIKNSLRDDDQVARWGGEEFLILLPDTDLEAGRKVAERIKEKLSEKPIIYNGDRVDLTMTFGVGIYNGDIGASLREADKALYEGKREGKNTVRFWGESTQNLSNRFYLTRDGYDAGNYFR